MQRDYGFHPRTHQTANGELVEHLFEGWLRKKNRTKMKGYYKARYFVLTEQRELEYYKDDKCIYTEQLGTLHLKAAKIVLSKSNKCKITIQSPERIMTLKAIDVNDRDKWVGWLVKAMNLANIMAAAFLHRNKKRQQDGGGNDTPSATSMGTRGSPYAIRRKRAGSGDSNSQVSLYEYEDSKVEYSVSSTTSMACHCGSCDGCKEKMRNFLESLDKHVQELEKDAYTAYSMLCKKYGMSDELSDLDGLDERPPGTPDRKYNTSKTANTKPSSNPCSPRIAPNRSVDASSNSTPSRTEGKHLRLIARPPRSPPRPPLKKPNSIQDGRVVPRPPLEKLNSIQDGHVAPRPTLKKLNSIQDGHVASIISQHNSRHAGGKLGLICYGSSRNVLSPKSKVNS